MLDQGVYERTVLAQTVVEMWTSGGSGRAHPANELSLINVDAGAKIRT